MKSQPSLCEVFIDLALDLGLPRRDVERMKDRFQHEGDRFFTSTLPKLGKALDKAFQTFCFSCPSNFRKRCRSALPVFLGSLFFRVFHPDGTLRDDADPVSVYAIRQLTFFAYKTNQPYLSRDEERVIDGFVATESELAKFELPEDPLLEVASLVVGSVFQGFDMKNVVGKHGPGVTANVPLNRKFEARLDGTLPSVRNFYSHFWFNESDQACAEPERISRHPVYTTFDHFRDNNVARVILVPKDSRGPRLISCEPAENQFIQQGIRVLMEDALGKHDLSKGHVNFSDQSINRNLAKIASETKRFATLDLKDASDRVSTQLVKRIFRYSPVLLDALLKTRSTRTRLPNGEIVHLRKFAPMGSACCFTVLSTCVWALSFAYALGRTSDVAVARDSVYVYGDDLIISTPLAQGVMDVLERYGLKVNRDKSFIGSPFAESCGFDAFNGNEVTPVRVRKWYHDETRTSQQQVLVSTVATAQLLSKAGLSRTAELLYRFAESHLGQLPFCSLTSPYLGRWTPYISTIPERILLNQRGVRWCSDRNLQRNPLGRKVKAWFVQPISREFYATGYGHASRLWPQLGTDSKPIEKGIHNLPRDWRLRVGKFDHYAMT